MAKIIINWEYEDNEIEGVSFEIYRDDVFITSITDMNIRSYSDDVTTLRDDATNSNEMWFEYKIYVKSADGKNSVPTVIKANMYDSLIPTMYSNEQDNITLSGSTSDAYKFFNDGEQYYYHYDSYSNTTITRTIQINLPDVIDFMAWGFTTKGLPNNRDEGGGIKLYVADVDNPDDFNLLSEFTYNELVSVLNSDRTYIKDFSSLQSAKSFKFVFSTINSHYMTLDFYDSFRIFGKQKATEQVD